jgi:two-component system chemotaxis response regulator CheB
MLGDGVAGLQAIGAAGGITVVQDPADARFPELPSRALQVFAPDHVLPASAIPSTLVDLVTQPAPASEIPMAIVIEAQIDRADEASPDDLDRIGERAQISCPDCHGPLWKLDEVVPRFRCYLGHVMTARQVLDFSAKEVEDALWSAVRALRDRAHTFEALAKDADRKGHTKSGEDFRTRAIESRRQADLARRFLLDAVRLA